MSAALAGAVADVAPHTLLARVQSCWKETVGEAVAAEAQPVSERGGTVTVSCGSAAWAHELELLAPELLGRLNEGLGGPSGVQVAALRFRAS